jgi:hypothetical protein
MGKSPWTINIHFKNEGKEDKTCPFQEGIPVGAGKVIRESEGGVLWWMYFVYVYENRTVKPVEIVLRMGESWVLVAHACNPSYSGGRDQEDCGLRPAQENSS